MVLRNLTEFHARNDDEDDDNSDNRLHYHMHNACLQIYTNIPKIKHEHQEIHCWFKSPL